ncbi:MAG: GPH family glycoside/pentoside/hexuronide:cation symporter [Myxococcota bacterium]
MKLATHYETAPQDRISFGRKLIYGSGAFVNNLLAAAIGGMIIVLNLGLGMNPALVGLLAALPRLTDAFTDPIVGYISDHTRSRWGRRRPFIFIGAILAGLTYVVLWQLPPGWSDTAYFAYFLVASLVFYLAYTIFATPWVALGYELTPDYHERTRLMGVQNFIGQLAYLVSPWFLWLMQHEGWFGGDMLLGARWLAGFVAVVTIVIGVLPAIFLRERFSDTPELEPSAAASRSLRDNLADFFGGFLATLKVRPFLKLCAATFLVFNGFMLVSSFQNYVIIYYVFGGDLVRGAEFSGYAGTASAIGTFAVIVFVTWLATKIGKRRAFFVAISVSIVGYAMKWPCYDPELPWLVVLPAPFIAFGLGGLFTLVGSMVADVCDVDALQRNERREGMFGAIFWWVVKLGMAAALAGGGFLLNATGFDVELGGAQTAQTLLLMRIFDVVVPMISSGIAIWAVASYGLTEEVMQDVRKQLEAGHAATDQAPLPDG